MKIFLSILCLAAFAAAQPVGETLQERSENLVSEINLVIKNVSDEISLSPYHERDNLKIKAHEIIRLSKHLSGMLQYFEKQAANRICSRAKAEGNVCRGTDEYKLGIVHVCLHTDKSVSESVKRFSNYSDCIEDLLDNYITHKQFVINNLKDLENSRINLEYELKDNEYNEVELIDVLKYHQETIIDMRKELDSSLTELRSLENDLPVVVDKCKGGNHAPIINARMFQIRSIEDCIGDFLVRNVSSVPAPRELTTPAEVESTTRKGHKSKETTDSNVDYDNDNVSNEHDSKRNKGKRNKKKHSDEDIIPYDDISNFDDVDDNESPSFEKGWN